MLNFYKIPESTIPYIPESNLNDGFYFLESDGVISNVAMTLDSFAGLVGDIQLKTFEEGQLPLKTDKDWDTFLEIVNNDEDTVELRACYQKAANRLLKIQEFNMNCFSEHPTQQLGYLVCENAPTATTLVILNISRFKRLFYEAYPHMYSANS